MSVNNEEIEKITSDKIHNRNCFAYLKHLKLSEMVYNQLSPDLAQRLKEVQAQTTYQSDTAYGDLYTAFFTEVENDIEKIYENMIKEKKDQEFNDFILSIYQNDNSILEDTFKDIMTIPLQYTPANKKGIERSISNLLTDEQTKINTLSLSPAQSGSALETTLAMISPEFKPQHTTSLATVRHYEYKEGTDLPKELRFGTQGQRHKGIPRSSPLFERYLDALQKKRELEIGAQGSNEFPIDHIYFNNLNYSERSRINPKAWLTGKIEGDLTKSLHKLEDRHSNVAVITLPADGGFMRDDQYTITKDTHSYQDVYNQFLAIASQDPEDKQPIKDFYISEKIRARIFKDEEGKYSPEEEKKQLKALLDKSFSALGIEPGTTLSSAQRQAVWFHFIKFELTNQIIEKLNPTTMNFSCKDAIDRGGVSSAYYNLMKSLQTDKPLSRDEFERGLHAAPAMVKARGMNNHLKLIWNSVNEYVNKNYDALQRDEKRAWLIEWRDFNCPNARVSDLLSQRLKENIEKLEKEPKQHTTQIALKILEKIKSYAEIGGIDKSMLLEVTVRTRDLALAKSFDQKKVDAYDKLTDKLTIQYPKLRMLAGLMKMVLGTIVSTFSPKMYKSGEETVNMGYPVEKTIEIKKQMCALKNELNTLKKAESTDTIANIDTQSHALK